MKPIASELQETTVKDNMGNPAVLYHGTKAHFKDFSDEHLQSLGFHFGCLNQAKHFAGTSSYGRIISAHLLVLSPADIRPSDCGWLQAQRTICCLFFKNLITYNEATELLDGGKISYAYYRVIESKEQRQALNRKTVALLESKGYDGIIYSNKQEPPDGIERDAYLVFHARQIYVLHHNISLA
jgi:hypothetical protein